MSITANYTDNIQNPSFQIKQERTRGRIGELSIFRDGVPLPSLYTPLLLPVVSFVTGTTAQGGGIWRYVLHGNTEFGLLRRNMPLMTQVLHFLDFNISPKSLAQWRGKTLRDRYNETHENLNYSAPLFLDSGGYKLLTNSQLDISKYGVPQDQDLPKHIVNLQRDFGGDIIASLDYPLPPNLVRNEAIERMEKSRRNAIIASRYLDESKDYSPLLYIAVHGQTGDDIRSYVKGVFEDRGENGLSKRSFGLAIGSLVPLRGSRKYIKIIELVRNAIAGIPRDRKQNTPIHVFGVSGTMIPLLVYLGVDTFDSSSYIQQARNLHYLLPDTFRKKPILELENLNCECPICQTIDFDDLHRILTTGRNYKPRPGDKYKSEYYAAIALHNLELDFAIVNRTEEAISSDDLISLLVEMGKKIPDLGDALEYLSTDDQRLYTQINKTINGPTKYHELEFGNLLSNGKSNGHSISLKFTPESFQIPDSYCPPEDKNVLLIIPCSSKKPYSSSRTHRFLYQKIKERFDKDHPRIHKVTLSGLYGPVPEEFEMEEAILRYEFQLLPQNSLQIDLLAERVIDYLEKFEDHYDGIYAYATSLAYRSVIESVLEKNKKLTLYPQQPKQRKLTEFFRNSNVNELLEALNQHNSN
jgi:7-cyano-7-deazaguanine tRNA-ribosyltransferase